MVDIVIRAKDGHDLTLACLASIKKNTPAGTYRTILVDDGSAYPYPAGLADVLIRSEQTRGAVTATNLGLSVSLAGPGEYVAVFDNDVTVPDGDERWLERFVSELNEYPGTGVVGATSEVVNLPQQILAVPQTYMADWSGGHKDNPPVGTFVSFACLFPKPVIAQVGLWDERYNPGNWEDTDYAVRVRQAGYSVRVARSVWLHHHGHKTFGDDLRMLLETNQRKFVEKWGLGRLFDMGFVSAEAMKGALQ